MAPDQRNTVALEQELEDMRRELQAANDRCAHLEETLREKEDLLTFVIKYNPNAIAVLDNNLHFMLASDRFREDYGVTDQKIIGRHHYDVFPEIPQVWRDIHARCLAGAHEFSEDDSFVREDGSVTYNRWDCRPWYNAQGEIGGLTLFTEVTTERKQAEQQLRLAQAALDQSADGMHWMQRDGLHIYVNNTVCRNLGYTRDELLQMRVADIDPNFPPEAWEPTWNKVKESGSLTFETVHSRKDGSGIPVEVTATYLNFDDQEYICAVSRDITERKQAEQQLRLAQAALDQSADGIEWLREDGFHIYVNDTMCNNLGYSREELLQMRVADFDPNFPVEAWAPVWQQVKEAGSLNLETVHQRKDGSTYPAEVTANYLESDGQEYIFSISRDITERKQAEERLRIFKALADNAPDAIGVADLDGTIFYANPAYNAIYGGDVVGMGVADTLTQETLETVVPEIFQSLEEHGLWRGVVVNQRKDGSTFPVEESAFNIYNQDGQPIATSAIMRDITEQRRAEAEMQRLVAVVENNNDFIGMVTLTGEPVYLNPAGLQMVGLTPDELWHTSMLDFVVPDERDWFVREVLPIIQQKNYWHGEIHFRHFKTDASIPIDYNAFLVRDKQSQEPLGIACVARDITEQKRAEAERIALQEQVIEAQRAAIRELSTPLMPLADGVVAMPLVGTIDSGRAQQIMETLLEGVSEHQARVAILDITGVQVVDTQIANALVQAAQAVRLLGANVVLTGIRPDVAQTLVHLGVDLGHLVTRGSLQSGIAYALEA
jgi:rsbT co-antagonist protein RsbR